MAHGPQSAHLTYEKLSDVAGLSSIQQYITQGVYPRYTESIDPLIDTITKLLNSEMNDLSAESREVVKKLYAKALTSVLRFQALHDQLLGDYIGRIFDKYIVSDEWKQLCTPPTTQKFGVLWNMMQ